MTNIDNRELVSEAMAKSLELRKLAATGIVQNLVCADQLHAVATLAGQHLGMYRKDEDGPIRPEEV